jgi:hypothetical protein
MRELFVEELASVVGGQKLPDVNDFVQSTMACCEEGPFGCCWWWDAVEDLGISIRP